MKLGPTKPERPVPYVVGSIPREHPHDARLRALQERGELGRIAYEQRREDWARYAFTVGLVLGVLAGVTGLALALKVFGQ